MLLILSMVMVDLILLESRMMMPLLVLLVMVLVMQPTATIGANITNVEKLVAIDLAADNNAGNVTITIASGFTGAFEIDGSQLRC